MLGSLCLTTASPVPFPPGCAQIYSPSSSQRDRLKNTNWALWFFFLKPRISNASFPLSHFCFQLWPPQVGFKSIHRTVATCCAHLEGGHCFLPGGFSKFEATKKPEAKDKTVPTLILSVQPFWESRFILFRRSREDTGEGNGNPLQCSCLENPRDGGAWWAAIYGVAQSWTRLKWLSSSSREDTIPW